ncbi:MAG TPA: hypothetical protein VEL75_22520 [Candidatus Methylomirabilis sp.]|nr:hypothetical protein [Candidatus Methylomirabilis sp.]
MDNIARGGYAAGLQGLVASMASVYPAYLRAGVGYWSEMAANSTSYWTELLESMIATWQRPEDGPAIFAAAVDRLRRHLELTGDSIERAVLEFNQGLVALGSPSPGAARGGDRVGDVLRGIADAATSEAWSQRAPDLAGLRRRLEALLAELCSLEGGSPGAGTAPRG